MFTAGKTVVALKMVFPGTELRSPAVRSTNSVWFIVTIHLVSLYGIGRPFSAPASLSLLRKRLLRPFELARYI